MGTDRIFSARQRVVGGFVALATTGLVLAAVVGGAGAATTTQTVSYACNGSTTDHAATWNGTSFTTSALLGGVHNLISSVPANPVLAGTFTTTAPASVAPGGQAAVSVGVSVALPADLIASASGTLGIKTVAVGNSTIAFPVDNASPSSFSGPLPAQTINLTPGTTVNATIAQTLTAANLPGSSILVKPGAAHVELTTNGTTGVLIGTVPVGIFSVTLNMTLFGLSFDCTPNNVPALAATLISGTPPVATTTIKATTTSNPSATTTAAPTTTTTIKATTTTNPSATTTTVKPTTTTTVKPTTTTTSTTTTTVKPSGGDGSGTQVAGETKDRPDPRQSNAFQHFAHGVQFSRLVGWIKWLYKNGVCHMVRQHGTNLGVCRPLR